MDLIVGKRAVVLRAREPVCGITAIVVGGCLVRVGVPTHLGIRVQGVPVGLQRKQKAGAALIIVKAARLIGVVALEPVVGRKRRLDLAPVVPRVDELFVSPAERSYGSGEGVRRFYG